MTPTSSSSASLSLADGQSALALNGSPAKAAAVGMRYRFVPEMESTLGATARFTVENLPAWAEFDTETGLLTGTPTVADLGQYAGILIGVTDGNHTAQLPAFTIVVGDRFDGAAILSWQPPTENIDGSDLVLHGYRIVYGTDPQDLDQSVALVDAGVTRYVIENLPPGDWYFGIVAVSSQGTRSTLSALAFKAIA